AILYAVQRSPRRHILHFKIRSKRIVRALTTDLASHEDHDWLGIPDSTLLKASATALRGRGTRCTFQQVDDLLDHRVKEASDFKGESRINFYAGDDAQPEIQTQIPGAHDLRGTKLSKSTQKSLYQAIKAQRKITERIKTKAMLDVTRHAARNLSGKTPTDNEIWRSIQNQDLSRTTRVFLWKCMHQAFKIGDRWRNIPTFEHWAICQHCQVDKTMEHILIDCEAPGRAKLWDLAKELW
ncbi:hypothetical protein K438DRAFT_1488797, partial [Mycena galopus ATCC 62051]